jgi:hypothetical protein
MVLIDMVIFKLVVRIGFISEGDTYEHVKLRLEELHLLNCDVIVCACRTRLSSFTAVWEFINLYPYN